MELDIGEWKIRSLTLADAPAIATYADNRKIWLNVRDQLPFPYAEEDAKTWIRQVQDHESETTFAIASAEEAIGGIGFILQGDVYRKSAEIGYWLGEPFWGQGIATRAVRTLTEYAFENFDLNRLYAGVFEWNPASVRVLEKAGYTLEGRRRQAVIKDGRLLDELMYGIVRGDLES